MTGLVPRPYTGRVTGRDRWTTGRPALSAYGRSPVDPLVAASAGEPGHDFLHVRAVAAILESGAGAARGPLHDGDRVDLAGAAPARDLEDLLGRAEPTESPTGAGQQVERGLQQPDRTLGRWARRVL